MKSNELCLTAKNVALGKFGKTRYLNHYPYNVGKYENGIWSFDCLGFVHTMVNGFAGDKSKIGGGAVMDGFVLNTTEINTLNNYCYDISSNFNHIDAGELLYKTGHVGLFIGEIQPFNDGRIFNTAECALSFGGVILTYTSETGGRYYHKGGTMAGSWSRHGKFYRVDYVKEKEKTQDILPVEVLNIVNDTFIGRYGNDPERRETLINLYGTAVRNKVQDIMNILYR